MRMEANLFISRFLFSLTFPSHLHSHCHPFGFNRPVRGRLGGGHGGAALSLDRWEPTNPSRSCKGSNSGISPYPRGVYFFVSCPTGLLLGHQSGFRFLT